MYAGRILTVYRLSRDCWYCLSRSLVKLLWNFLSEIYWQGRPSDWRVLQKRPRKQAQTSSMPLSPNGISLHFPFRGMEQTNGIHLSSRIGNVATPFHCSSFLFSYINRDFFFFFFTLIVLSRCNISTRSFVMWINNNESIDKRHKTN